jgi:tight adherence protein C
MIETVIPFLAFLSVVAIGASFLLAQKQKQKMMEIRLQDSRFVEMPEKEEAKKLGFLKLLAQIGNVVSHGNASRTLNEQMVRAGYIGSAAPAIYTGVKILLFLLGLVIMTAVLMPTGLSDAHKAVLIVLAATIVFFLPNFIVVSQLRRRREEIRQHLPEAVDLLEICVSSGLGLDMAWHMVSEEIQQVSPILANAMSLTNFEINLGSSRVEALRHMAERTGVNELSSLATILIQTERFGTSIAETLKIFANSMREERTHIAEESAEKMAVKMLFPMVLCIFPAVLVTVAGPALITLFGSKLFGSG